MIYSYFQFHWLSLFLSFEFYRFNDVLLICDLLLIQELVVITVLLLLLAQPMAHSASAFHLLIVINARAQRRGVLGPAKRSFCREKVNKNPSIRDRLNELSSPIV